MCIAEGETRTTAGDGPVRRWSFVSVMFGVVLAWPATPVWAQFSGSEPRSLVREAPVDPQTARANALRVDSLNCSELLNHLPERTTRDPLGVPDVEWTPELFGVLRQRATECSVNLDRSDRAFVRSKLNYGERFLLPRAQAARVERAAEVARKADLLARIDAVRSSPPADQLRLLDAIQASLPSTGLTPSERVEVSGALLRAQVDADAAREAERAEERRAAEARKAELAAEADRQAKAFEVRVAALGPPVRALIRRNPGLLRQSRESAAAFLLGLHKTELALRICARETGGYARELQETNRRRKLFEDYVEQFHQFSAADLKAERDALGVETGSGRAADLISADRFALRQACDAALAFSSSALDFGT